MKDALKTRLCHQKRTTPQKKRHGKPYIKREKKRKRERKARKIEKRLLRLPCAARYKPLHNRLLGPSELPRFFFNYIAGGRECGEEEQTSRENMKKKAK